MCFLHGEKEKETLTREAYDKLPAWLSLHGEGYQDCYDRLVMFFEVRKCRHPKECTDETLDRADRNLDAGKVSMNDPPGAYCHGVAKNVWREYLKCKLNDEDPLTRQSN